MNHLLCFGLGYVAKRLIQNLTSESKYLWKFFATSRSINFMKNLDKIYNDLDEITLPKNITHILISIPPTLSGDIVYDKFVNSLLKSDKLIWIGYLSSTGVYGNHDGEWVNEYSDLLATDNYALNRCLAENKWIESFQKYKLPIHIFRLAGIYGPQRSMLEYVMRNDARIINNPQTIFSRIHVDDVIQTLKLSMNNIVAGSIYNVADDYPCNPREVIEEACRLLNIDVPMILDIEQANLSDFAKSLYNNRKRVDNSRIKRELEVKLQYPSYKLGLTSIAQECNYKIYTN